MVSELIRVSGGILSAHKSSSSALHCPVAWPWSVACCLSASALLCFSSYQQLLLLARRSVTLQLSANKSSDLPPAFRRWLCSLTASIFMSPSSTLSAFFCHSYFSQCSEGTPFLRLFPNFPPPPPPPPLKPVCRVRQRVGPYMRQQPRSLEEGWADDSLLTTAMDGHRFFFWRPIHPSGLVHPRGHIRPPFYLARRSAQRPESKVTDSVKTSKRRMTEVVYV